MTISLASFYALISTISFLAYWLIIVATTLRIVIKKQPTSAVVAWLLLIYILPIVGVILYFLLGEVHLGQKRIKRAVMLKPQINAFTQKLSAYPEIFTHKVSQVARPLFQLCQHQTGLGAISGNDITLYFTPDSIFDAIIQDIHQAQSNIEMVFYIWNQGGRADEIEQALIEASRRGIKCRIMLDSAGSRHYLRSEAVKHLRAQGVDVIEVLKVNLLRFMFRRLDLRQHRKMVIIDNHVSYTGSMNIVDPRFFKQDKAVGEWVDIMIRMVGPITTLMSSIYASDWELETGHRLELPQVLDFATPPEEAGHTMQLISSGPGYSENLIHQALLSAIYAAQKQIIFTTPYLVPSDDLLNAICTAAQRGVEIIIIVPKKNDSIMVQWASRAFFTVLLDAKVTIYEFNNNLLHTKSVLVDEQLSFVGTVNLDMRSLWLNFEITALIDDKQFSIDLKRLLDTYRVDSNIVDADLWASRPVWQRLVERLFYFFAPLL